MCQTRSHSLPEPRSSVSHPEKRPEAQLAVVVAQNGDDFQIHNNQILQLPAANGSVQCFICLSFALKLIIHPITMILQYINTGGVFRVDNATDI